MSEKNEWLQQTKRGIEEGFAAKIKKLALQYKKTN